MTYTWPQTKPTSSRQVESNNKTTTDQSLQLKFWQPVTSHQNHYQRHKYHHLTWLWRWLSLRWSKHQSPTTVFLKTTLNQTITLDNWYSWVQTIYHVDVLIGKCCWMDWILLDQNTHILMIIGNCIRWNFACKFIIFFSSISFPTLNMKMDFFCCKNCQYTLTLSLPRAINFNFLFQSLTRDIYHTVWRT